MISGSNSVSLESGNPEISALRRELSEFKAYYFRNQIATRSLVNQHRFLKIAAAVALVFSALVTPNIFVFLALTAVTTVSIYKGLCALGKYAHRRATLFGRDYDDIEYTQMKLGSESQLRNLKKQLDVINNPTHSTVIQKLENLVEHAPDAVFGEDSRVAPKALQPHYNKEQVLRWEVTKLERLALASIHEKSEKILKIINKPENEIYDSVRRKYHA